MSLKVFAAALVSFLVLDGLWLGVIMKTFYRTALGPIARTASDGSLAPIWAVALPVYALLALGITLFVFPRVQDSSVVVAAGTGAVFGLVVYGVYDLTNWSTLKHYGPVLALVDIGWGMVACAGASLTARLVGP
jgi:uncharacterized membrane protein